MGDQNGRMWVLTVDGRDVDGRRVLTVRGRISGETSPVLANALNDAVKENRKVVLDLASVDYISGAGLEAIRQAAERLNASGGELALSNVQDSVRIAVELSRIGPLLAGPHQP